MYYQKLTNEQLQKLKHPNLMAEFIESHYSICTIAEHMGLGRRKENDPVIWGKLRGTIDIFANEAVGLCRLFGTEFEYLFSDKLDIFCGRPVAEIRWEESNRRMEEELKKISEIQEIERELRKNPELLQLIKTVRELSGESRKELLAFMQKEMES